MYKTIVSLFGAKSLWRKCTVEFDGPTTGFLTRAAVSKKLAPDIDDENELS